MINAIKVISDLVITLLDEFEIICDHLDQNRYKTFKAYGLQIRFEIEFSRWFGHVKKILFTKVYDDKKYQLTSNKWYSDHSTRQIWKFNNHLDQKIPITFKAYGLKLKRSYVLKSWWSKQ